MIGININQAKNKKTGEKEENWPNLIGVKLSQAENKNGEKEGDRSNLIGMNLSQAKNKKMVKKRETGQI